MAYDSSDPKDVKNAKARAHHLMEREANGIIKICQDPDSRYVLSNFLETARVFQPCFDQVPTQHAYNEGFRNAALFWLNKALLHDPQIMVKIQQDKDRNKKENDDDGRSTDSDNSNN